MNPFDSGSGTGSFTAAPPAPTAAAPSPPMFGSQPKGAAKVKSQSATNSGFSGTILGALGVPQNTGQKTLLGQ